LSETVTDVDLDWALSNARPCDTEPCHTVRELNVKIGAFINGSHRVRRFEFLAGAL
jgi:hypothetical protein